LIDVRKGRPIVSLAIALTAAAAVSLCTAGATHSGVSSVASVFVSSSGSDSNPCTKAEPCLSFDRGYHVAKPGQVVGVAPGTYPDQTVTADPTKGSPAVKFVPTGSGDVRVADLTVQASLVQFQDLAIRGIWYVGVNDQIPRDRQPHDVVMRDIDAAHFYITGASRVSVLGGSLGPTVDRASEIKGCYLCTYAPQDILIDGVTFHDFTRRTSGVHMECLHVYPAQGFVIRNSRFFNCAIMDLFFSNYGQGGDLRDITIENNLFDTPGSHAGALSKGYYALYLEAFGRSITNVRIAYNSMVTGSIPDFDSSAQYKGIVVYANVGVMNQRFCASGVTYAYNVWTDAKCGATDTTAPTGFVNPARLDLHLTPDAAAIGHGDPHGHPLLDIEGRVRPSRLSPDAGAYQRESAQIVFGKSIGAAAIGSNQAAIVAFYGQPATTRSVRVGTRQLQELVYQIHGGTLAVTVARGRVVGVTTTSAYYRTAGNMGATARMGAVRGWTGVRWIPCRRAYRRAFNGVPVYVTPRGGRSGATIAAISMIKGDAGTCG
jgi:hypothetical protein